jgi:large subunit ribosomal protein L29
MKLKESKRKMREMTPLELDAKLKSTVEELFNIRFQLATGHLEDFTKIRQHRKDIARLKTVKRQKELKKSK